MNIKSNLKKYLMYLLVASISFVPIVMSSAQAEQYNYDGNPFEVQDGDISFLDAFDNVIGELEGFFTTTAPLGPNFALQDIRGLITSFSYTDNSATPTTWSSDVGSTKVIFKVGTGADGLPSDWRIVLRNDADQGNCQADGTCQASSDAGLGDWSDEVVYDVVTDVQHGKTPEPGTWNISTTPSAPPGILFAGAIALLLLMLRRNSVSGIRN